MTRRNSRPTSPGHVFVVKADVTTIMCDAWLCSTDRDFKLEQWARKALGIRTRHLKGHSWGRRRAIPYNRDAKPLIVLGDVGQTTASGPDEIEARLQQLFPVIDQFADVATKHFAGRTSNLPLRLALPLIGTGRGGLRGIRGHTLRPLLNKLDSVAREAHVDIVLCTYNALAWSAVQASRTLLQWPLTREEIDLAKELAAKAQAEGLVLFIGAGVGRDVDLPHWRELLQRLSESRLRDLSPRERRDLPNLDLRDYATLIENDLSRAMLLRKLEEALGRDDLRVGLTHALLASLQVQQAVTTNYDNLFERACAYDGRPIDKVITVLPYGKVEPGRPWLLKLHGSLDHRDASDIVLTRSDYMRLRHERGALYGIVQALLVTKHLLFVGYSLSDEDFHELADEIRTALEPTPAEPAGLGTVLTIGNSAWGRLWGDLFTVKTIGPGSPALAGRRLQIFLDFLAHLTTPQHAYLLNPAFDGLLNDEQKTIAERLRDLDKVLAASDDSAAQAIRKALSKFGAADAR